MYRIRFEYRDRYTNGNWSHQECEMTSVEECIEWYGLGKDCEYRILEAARIHPHTDKVIVDDHRSGAFRMLRTYGERNAAGEKIFVEVERGRNPGTRNSLPALWHRNGWTDHELDSWWHVTVEAVEDDRSAYHRYNPMVKPGGAGFILDFDWVLEDTRENLDLLFTEIERRAFDEVEVGEENAA